jgi:anti-sigma B factor antagonist
MGRPLVLPLRGEIDIAVATSLRPGWYALAEQEHLQEIVVDLQDVTFMDASGLGLLVGTRNRQRGHGGDLRLCNAHAHLLTLLRLTGLSAVFPDADLPCSDLEPPPRPSTVDVRDMARLHAAP